MSCKRLATLMLIYSRSSKRLPGGSYPLNCTWPENS